MKRKPTSHLSFALTTAFATLLSTPFARALDGTWLGTSGNWSDGSTWVDGTIADGADFSANFTGVNITAAPTITLTAPQTIGNINFTDATTSSHNLTIGGASILTLDVTTGSPSINVSQGDRTLSIGCEVAGTKGLTKAGAGVLSLAGVNTYSGETNVAAGRLAASHVNALGSTSSIVIGGASAASLSSGNSGLIITAPITTANSGVSSTLAFGVAANATGSFTLNGAIGGSGNVIYSTVGTSNNNLQTINLGAAGTYAGTTTITSGVSANSNIVKNTSAAANVLPITTELKFTSIAGTGSGRVTNYDLNGQDQTLAGLNYTGAVPNLRGFNVTSTAAATLTIDNSTDYSFGGATNAPSTIAPNPIVTTHARITGAIALTKKGAGTFTLGGTLTSGATVNNHNYTGATNILGGTLRIGTNAAITASSGITINGSSAKLLQTSNTAIAPIVTLTQGTLTGSGTVNTVNVGDATGGIISNNNGVAGAPLLIDTLTFDGAATVDTFNSSTAAAIETTSLATNIAGKVTINPTVPPFVSGTYDLISYGGGIINGAGFAQFALGTITGASQRQTTNFSDSGTAITLTLGPDDAPFWDGSGNGKWNLAAVNNWKLSSSSAATLYLEKDNVLFDDAALGSGPILVDIDVANVSPSSTIFDNSAKDYVLNSSGAFGIATGNLTKYGTGNLTINSANSFPGTTAIEGGIVSLGDGGANGSLSPASAITVASGTTFAVNQSDTVTQGTDFGVISGSGGFAQRGSGTTVLNLINGFTGPIEIANGTLAIGVDGRLGAGTYAGDINIATATSIFEHGSSLNQTLSGIISGDGSLRKTGTNTLTLSGANTYIGATVVSSGILSIANVNALQNTSGITLGGAFAATLSTATDAMTISVPITTADSGVDSTIAFAIGSAATGTLSLNGAIGGNGNVIFTTPNVGASVGNVQTISLGATGTWAGTTTMTTANQNVATRIVNASTGANVLPITTVLNMTGGTGAGSGRAVTFDLNGKNQELAGLQNTLAVDRDQRVTSVAAATLTINNSADYAFGGTVGSGADDGSGKITGAISLTKTGAAKFTLLGDHIYTGNTTVSQGILSQEAPNVSNETSIVTIAESGATLDLNFSGTDTVKNLFIGATQQAAGVYGALSSGAQFEIAQISGTGTITVTRGPGGYSTWAESNAGDQLPDLDFDQDGVSNGVEYFLNAPAGFTANPQLNASNTITWINGGNIPAADYGTKFVVQTSSNLTTWTDVPAGELTTNTDGPSGSLSYTLTGAAPRFVRLKVTPD
jgi:autotransporter-associated beta strand protein